MIPGLAASFIAGGIGWTFAEYSIHNWVMHGGKGKNEFSRQHLNHHANPNQFAPLWVKYLTEALVLAALGALATWIAGWRNGLSFALGFFVVYHGYEVLHERLHTHPPRGPVGRFLRRHHMTHHFVAPTMNHGVTFPLWDLLFGTYVAAPKIMLPARHAMSWLLDPATGEVRPEYAADYGVRRSSVSPRQAELDREAAFSNLVLR